MSSANQASDPSLGIPTSLQAIAWLIDATGQRKRFEQLGHAVGLSTFKTILQSKPTPRARRDFLEQALPLLLPQGFWTRDDPRSREVADAADNACTAYDALLSDLHGYLRVAIRPEWSALPFLRLLAIELGLRWGAARHLRRALLSDVAPHDGRPPLLTTQPFANTLRELLTGSGLRAADVKEQFNKNTVDDWLAERALPRREGVVEALAAMLAKSGVLGSAEMVEWRLRCALLASRLRALLQEVVGEEALEALIDLGVVVAKQFESITSDERLEVEVVKAFLDTSPEVLLDRLQSIARFDPQVAFLVERLRAGEITPELLKEEFAFAIRVSEEARRHLRIQAFTLVLIAGSSIPSVRTALNHLASHFNGKDSHVMLDIASLQDDWRRGIERWFQMLSIFEEGSQRATEEEARFFVDCVSSILRPACSREAVLAEQERLLERGRAIDPAAVQRAVAGEPPEDGPTRAMCDFIFAMHGLDNSGYSAEEPSGSAIERVLRSRTLEKRERVPDAMLELLGGLQEPLDGVLLAELGRIMLQQSPQHPSLLPASYLFLALASLLAPQDVTTAKNTALIELEMQAFEQVVRRLEPLREIAARDGLFWKLLALAYEGLGRRSDAKHAATQARHLGYPVSATSQG